MSQWNASPVESERDFGTFCTLCGRRLVTEEINVGFRKDTGAPILRAMAYCRGSWYDRLLGLEGHDRYIVSPRPIASVPPPR